MKSKYILTTMYSAPMVKLILLILLIILNIESIRGQMTNTPDTIKVKRVEIPDDYLIDNINYSIRDNVFHITYDLIAHPGRGPFEISIGATAGIQQGRNRSIRPRAVTGDVGKNIQPGRGKTIIWHYTRDIPSGAYANNIQITIEISRNERTSGFPFILMGILTGAIVGSGAAYYFLNRESDEPGLGGFPVRPSN